MAAPNWGDCRHIESRLPRDEFVEQALEGKRELVQQHKLNMPIPR